MRTVYQAAHAVEAELVCGLLRHDRITAHVFGAIAAGGRGELPVEYPRVVVEDDADFERARALIADYERGPPAAPPWRCAGCGEPNEDVFGACWNCLAARAP